MQSGSEGTALRWHAQIPRIGKCSSDTSDIHNRRSHFQPSCSALVPCTLRWYRIVPSYRGCYGNRSSKQFPITSHNQPFPDRHLSFIVKIRVAGLHPRGGQKPAVFAASRLAEWNTTSRSPSGQSLYAIGPAKGHLVSWTSHAFSQYG